MALKQSMKITYLNKDHEEIEPEDRCDFHDNGRLEELVICKQALKSFVEKAQMILDHWEEEDNGRK